MSGQVSRESDKFVLRLPDGMRERIKNAADANSRSMNSEIVAALEQKFPKPSLDDFSLRDLSAYLAEITDKEKRLSLERSIENLRQAVSKSMAEDSGLPSISLNTKKTG